MFEDIVVKNAHNPECVGDLFYAYVGTQNLLLTRNELWDLATKLLGAYQLTERRVVVARTTKEPAA